jgi:hypothetical protein
MDFPFREAVSATGSTARENTGEFTWEQWIEIAVDLIGGYR